MNQNDAFYSHGGCSPREAIQQLEDAHKYKRQKQALSKQNIEKCLRDFGDFYRADLQNIGTPSTREHEKEKQSTMGECMHFI